MPTLAELHKDAAAGLGEAGLVKPFPDAASFLGCSRPTVYKLMQQGQLATVRVGADLRIPKRALVEFIEKNIVVAASVAAERAESRFAQAGAAPSERSAAPFIKKTTAAKSETAQPAQEHRRVSQPDPTPRRLRSA